MFTIEQENARALGWPTPGLLVVVSDEGTVVFYHTGDQTARFRFDTRLAGHLGPTPELFEAGLWLNGTHDVWDISDTVKALNGNVDAVPDPVKCYECPEEFPVHSLYAFSPDGRFALRHASRDYIGDGFNQILTLPEFEVLSEPPTPNPKLPYAQAISERFIVWFEGRFPPQKKALVYSLEDGKLQATLTHTQGINQLVVSPDGRQVATAAGVTVRVWDLESGECIRKFKGQRGKIQAITFHPSGQMLGVCCLDETVRLWDIGSGKELESWSWGKGLASQIAFSPDGSTAAALTPQAVIVWDLDC